MKKEKARKTPFYEIKKMDKNSANKSENSPPASPMKNIIRFDLLEQLNYEENDKMYIFSPLIFIN